MLYPIELLGQERALMVTSSGGFVMFRFGSAAVREDGQRQEVLRQLCNLLFTSVN